MGTSGGDTIDGNGGDDTIDGAGGDDSIDGGNHADIIQGGTGDDVLSGGLGDDSFLFSDSVFDSAAWTDVIDGGAGDTDTIDLANVTQGWTLEVDGAGEGPEATNLSDPSQYTNGGEFSGTITFDDGSAVVFDNIEKVDW